MTSEVLVNIIGNFGFPIAAVFGLGWFVWIVIKFIKKQFEDNEKERKAVSEQYINSLLAMNTQLLEVLKENTSIIKKNTEVILKFSKLLDKMPG